MVLFFCSLDSEESVTALFQKEEQQINSYLSQLYQSFLPPTVQDQTGLLGQQYIQQEADYLLQMGNYTRHKLHDINNNPSFVSRLRDEQSNIVQVIRRFMTLVRHSALDITNPAAKLGLYEQLYSSTLLTTDLEDGWTMLQNRH